MNFLNITYNNVFLISCLFSIIYCYVTASLGFSKLWTSRLFNAPMFVISIVLFLIFLFLFQILDLNTYKYGDIILSINENNNNTPNFNVGENATVNIYNPNISASFSSMDRVGQLYQQLVEHLRK